MMIKFWCFKNWALEALEFSVASAMRNWNPFMCSHLSGASCNGYLKRDNNQHPYGDCNCYRSSGKTNKELQPTTRDNIQPSKDNNFRRQKAKDEFRQSRRERMMRQRRQMQLEEQRLLLEVQQQHNHHSPNNNNLFSSTIRKHISSSSSSLIDSDIQKSIFRFANPAANTVKTFQPILAEVARETKEASAVLLKPTTRQQRTTTVVKSRQQQYDTNQHVWFGWFSGDEWNSNNATNYISI